MPLHLLKLAVGAGSIAELEDHVAERCAKAQASGSMDGYVHITRMLPKKSDQLLSGGSLYWVIKGHIAARQELRDIRAYTDSEGVARCRLVLEPKVVAVMSRPCRAFQGWRYLPHATRPADLGRADGTAAMPEHLRYALRELCLL
jgi:hypothetical protein